uniref:Uncharacterized protein n=1 Tax=viral metagenome TaxID=1070528 RepID=A0A6M3LXE7_9ZZZZ
METPIIKTIKQFLLYFLIAFAAFQSGIIYEIKISSIEKRIAKLETNQQTLSGEFESQAAMLRGISKGRLPQLK